VIPEKVAKEIQVLLGPEARISLVADRGLSSAIVYRIETHSNWFALKRWPLLLDRDHLDSIHRFQQFLAEGDRACTPRLMRWCHGGTCLDADSVHWELAEWKSGHPIEHLGQVSDQQLREAMEAIARMHQRSQQYVVTQGPAPGLRQRLEGLRRCIDPPNDKRQRFLDSIVSHGDSSASKILVDLGVQAKKLAVQCLEPIREWSQSQFRCFWILRDVWREHLLFRGDHLIGILDFGAARVDWPGLDLVRSLGTLLLDSDPRWTTALAIYSRAQPETTLELELLKIVHRASIAISALQWLDWFADGQFDWTLASARSWQRVLELRAQLTDIEKSMGSQGTLLEA
jgi:Ser/Thr protein kinase RdoA (MazF antagonist)